MHVAAVDEAGGIEIGADDVANGLAIDHLHDLVPCRVRQPSCTWPQAPAHGRAARRPAYGEFQVALDAIFLDTVPDDALAAPTQVPDEILRLGSERACELLEHCLVTGE